MKKTVAVTLCLSLLTAVVPVFAMDENNDTISESTAFRYDTKGEMPIIPEEWAGLEDGTSFIDDEDSEIAPAFVTDNIVDEQENNNTALRARDITLSKGRTGVIGSESDVDFYKFVCPADGKYRFDLIDIPASKSLDYDIFMYTGNPAVEVGQSARTDEYDSVIVELEQGTTYYLKVVGFDGAYSVEDYYYVTVTDDECAVLGYQYPFRGNNVPKRITTNYGYYAGTQEPHYGLDLVDDTGTIDGTTLYAPAIGKVISAGWDDKYGAGYHVSIDVDNEYDAGHDNTVVTYMHMKSNILVKEDDTVRMGTQVGYVGNTGNSFGSHLHIGMMTHGGWIAGQFANTNNPLRYYPQYKYTGLTEDREEYQNGSEITPQSIDMLPRYIEIIPISVIKRIGVDEFDYWVNHLKETPYALPECLEYFNISSEEFGNIVNQSNSLKEMYTNEAQKAICEYRDLYFGVTE